MTIQKNKMIESIRTGIRKQVVELYQLWASNVMTKTEFETAMWDTRRTAECIVESMENMTVLDSDEALNLCKFIHALTETY